LFDTLGSLDAVAVFFKARSLGDETAAFGQQGDDLAVQAVDVFPDLFKGGAGMG
jgi:hypothetical protein